ncbi:MAG: Gfo/Idh/MocA family oxidoreductase [Planctomycetes bacterium]|nr:Gfo/Idh/MocA family oxidoreductase [Planctomycetota bacterium]
MANVGRTTRRAFLGTAGRSIAGLAAGPLIFTGRVLGANDRLVLGSIGCGGQGTGDMGAIRGSGGVDVAAVCDVYEPHRERARASSGGTAEMYNDFRDLLDRKDIDIVNIGTPDHWHALIAIAACRAGKDIYCQKPLSLTIEEGRAMVDAVRRYGRVFQTGSQQRSDGNFRYACELVQNRRIGELERIETGFGGSPAIGWEPDADPPPGLDWDLYLGPARKVPFNPRRFLWDFRWFFDYSGGQMTDWGAHHNDIAQWGNGTERSGPIEVEGRGEFPRDAMSDTATGFELTYTYANGVKLVCASRFGGVTFCGPKGKIHVDRGHLSSDPPSIIQEPIAPNEIHLYESPGHYQDFIDCVKARRRPICDVEIGHRSVTVCHIGNICLRLGRKLRWDPVAERFVGDEAANRWIGRPMRKPWHL